MPPLPRSFLHEELRPLTVKLPAAFQKAQAPETDQEKRACPTAMLTPSNKQEHRDSSWAQPCREVKAEEGAALRKTFGTYSHNETVFRVERNEVQIHAANSALSERSWTERPQSV